MSAPIRPALAALLLLLAAPGAAAAADTFVVTDSPLPGADCTQAHPCGLVGALSRANGHDTILFKNGTYNRGTLPITLAKPLILRGEDGPRPRITATGDVLELGSGAAGTEVHHLSLGDFSDDGSRTVLAVGSAILDDVELLASGPGVTAGDVSALVADAPVTLSNAQVVVNATGANSTHESVLAHNGNLTLRNVDVTRTDSVATTAVAGAPGSIDADGLHIHTHGGRCLRTLSASVLRNVTAEQLGPPDPAGTECLSIGGDGTQLLHASVQSPHQVQSVTVTAVDIEAVNVVVDDLAVIAERRALKIPSLASATVRRANLTAGTDGVANRGTLVMTDSVARVTASGAPFGALRSSGVADVRNATLVALNSSDGRAAIADGATSRLTLTNVIARGTAQDIDGGGGAKVSVTASNYRPDRVLVHDGAELTTGAGNQDANALPARLADPANGDVHEVAGSPTIDAGIADPLLGPTDLDGDPRTLGSAPDIGADEFAPPPPAAITPPPPAPPPDTTPPTLSSVSLSHTTFAATTASAAKRAPRGTVVRYRLSEAAEVTVAITRTTTGRRSHGRCVATTKRNRRARRCTRPIAVGSVAAAGTQGANSLPFSGRVRGRALTPGRYRATLTAVDAAKNRSKPVGVSFTIVSR
jgi:hypothetical protein